MKYRSSRKEAELHQAWDLYYHVFKRINKQLHSLTTLELQYVAPALVRATGMELAVPGTYIAGEPLVTIAAFAPQLQVGKCTDYTCSLHLTVDILLLSTSHSHDL